MLEYNQNQINTIDANSGSLIRERELLGYINSNCFIIKNILLGIIKFTPKEEIIFSNDYKIKLNNLYNMLNYD